VIQKLHYIGDITKHDINVDEKDNINLIVDGRCNLTGKISAPGKIIEVWVNGKNQIKFKGRCKKLILRNICGTSTIDFRDLICNVAVVNNTCGKSKIILFVLDRIKKVNLADETFVYLANCPRICNLSLLGRSKIEHFINVE
jgi:hypothetical protein